MNWGKKVGGEGLCDPLGMDQRGKGDLSRFPATELGMRLGEGESQRKQDQCSSVLGLLAALRGASPGLSGDACWGWGLGQSNRWGEES